MHGYTERKWYGGMMKKNEADVIPFTDARGKIFDLRLQSTHQYLINFLKWAS